MRLIVPSGRQANSIQNNAAHDEKVEFGVEDPLLAQVFVVVL